jgi:hypothetical protein
MFIRSFLILLAIFCSGFCGEDSTSRQSPFLKIYGQVNGKYRSGKLAPVHDATVTIKIHDSVKYSQSTDENGHFELNIPKQPVSAKIFVRTSRQTQVKEKKFELFLPGPEQYKINLDTNGTLSYNFEVRQAYIDFNFPEFLFKPNSTEFDTDTSITFFSPANAVNWYAEFLNEKKSMIIEFTAYSNTNEKNYNNLKELRAKKIQGLFNSKRINPDQIKIKTSILPSRLTTEARKSNPSGYVILLRGATIKILSFQDE